MIEELMDKAVIIAKMNNINKNILNKHFIWRIVNDGF